LSLVYDTVGVYYDATRSSALEQLLNGESSESAGLADSDLLQRARRCIDQIARHRLSKYNNSPPTSPRLEQSASAKPVLVIDQTRNDQSILRGLISEDSFDRMLEAALEENPDSPILIKTHPDVLAGKKRGHYPASARSERVSLKAEPINPIALLEQVDRVYTGTSQMGFEALMLGKRVTCFGAPFYAGWGLTDDRIEIPRRGKRRTVEELFAAAYILYSRYLCPDTGKSGEIEDVIEHLARQRRFFELNKGAIYCLGFSRWKRNYVRAYLRSPSNKVIFVKKARQAERRGFDNDSRLLVWGMRRDEEARTLAERHGVPIWRMEDGFLRSIGLGSDLTVPASLVVDTSGVYYDPRSPSDLEHLLRRSDRSEDRLKRAALLREQIVTQKLSKYNVDSTKQIDLRETDDRPVLLVPGQVEDDASIQLGCVDIKTNADLLEAVRADNPNAFIVFKPHPDVISGNRKGRVPEARARTLCDHVVNEASISSCLDVADAVHTMTSLVGFEALLRGIEVTTYGRPFYAGYGLTRDRHPLSRRDRRLTLDDLVAATLIEYPRYLNGETRAFTTPEYVVSNLAKKVAQDAGKTSARARWYVRKLRKLYNVLKGILDVG
jgi:capsular polysaccharide export protein